MDIRKIIAVSCITVGIGLMSIPFLFRLKGEQETEDLLKSFESTMEVHADEKIEEKEAKTYGKTTDSKKTSTLSKENSMSDDVIGIIEIDSLDIKYPIVEGTGKAELRYAIGHLSDTANVGEGNCVLAGHNGSRYGEYFTYLNKISVGDEIKVTDRSGKIHKYLADKTMIVGPKENSIKDQDSIEIEDDIVETTEEFNIVASGWYCYIPSIGIYLRAGTVCNWDEDAKIFMPDFDVTVIYENENDIEEYIYFEQDNFVTSLHNWIASKNTILDVTNLECEVYIPT